MKSSIVTILPRYLIVLVIGLFLASRALGVASTFDSGLDGWTSNTPAEISWQASGGNPGGYVRFTDVSGDSTEIYAPAKFLGDWSGLDEVGLIAFDHRIYRVGVNPTFWPYRIALTGLGGRYSGRRHGLAKSTRTDSHCALTEGCLADDRRVLVRTLG
jgi:hypothetical protein